MHSATAVAFLAAGLVAAQGNIYNSILSEQSSVLSVIATASDPGAVETSFVNHLTSTFNPSQISQYQSLTSQYNLNGDSSLTQPTALSSLGSSIGSVVSSAQSQASSRVSSATSDSIHVSGTASTGSSNAAPAPTGINAGSLLGVAGAFGAAAFML